MGVTAMWLNCMFNRIIHGMLQIPERPLTHFTLVSWFSHTHIICRGTKQSIHTRTSCLFVALKHDCLCSPRFVRWNQWEILDYQTNNDKYYVGLNAHTTKLNHWQMLEVHTAVSILCEILSGLWNNESIVHFFFSALPIIRWTKVFFHVRAWWRLQPLRGSWCALIYE